MVTEFAALRAGDCDPFVMPTAVDQVAVARLYGEPLFSLPQDLYIPPDALEVLPGGSITNASVITVRSSAA